MALFSLLPLSPEKNPMCDSIFVTHPAAQDFHFLHIGGLRTDIFSNASQRLHIVGAQDSVIKHLFSPHGASAGHHMSSHMLAIAPLSGIERPPYRALTGPYGDIEDMGVA